MLFYKTIKKAQNEQKYEYGRNGRLPRPNQFSNFALSKTKVNAQVKDIVSGKMDMTKISETEQRLLDRQKNKEKKKQRDEAERHDAQLRGKQGTQINTQTFIQ